MVASVKFKRTKSKNFMSTHPEYPRDIWEFVAKSKERALNTQSGALLKDVLDFQALTPRKMEAMQREREFPKTIFPKIDPERLKPRAVSVDPDVLRMMKLANRRHNFLDNGPKDKKAADGLGPMKGHFDVAAMEQMVADYKKNRPGWLQPKRNDVGLEVKKKDFDPARGISKAEQEEMLTAHQFKDAKEKSERAQALRRAFHHNMLEGKLLRVQSDISTNRVFFEPELRKGINNHAYFQKKMVDPNLDIRVIESASPTKFFEMVHRRLNPANYRPEGFNEILQSVTAEPEEDNNITFETSPYLTYVCPPNEKPYPRPGDEERWGRRKMDEIYDWSVGTAPRPLHFPKGLGKTIELHPTKGTRRSPWMGGGSGPSSPKTDKATDKTSPGSIRKVESSTFITQKSGFL